MSNLLIVSTVKGTKACSTDGAGLLNDLESKKIDYQNMNILVYGLGGAATSILETINSNKKIFISNRTEKKSSELMGKKIICINTMESN